MTRPRASTAFLVAALAMCGCDPGQGEATSRVTGSKPAAATPTPNPRLDISMPYPDGPPPTPAPTPSPASSEPMIPPLSRAMCRFELKAPAEAPLGKPLSVELHYTNTSQAEQVFRLTSGQRWDVELRDAAGARRLRWSDNQMFTMALRSLRVKPGETLRETLELDLAGAGIAPGAYTLVGSVGGTFETISQPLAITVTP